MARRKGTNVAALHRMADEATKAVQQGTVSISAHNYGLPPTPELAILLQELCPGVKVRCEGFLGYMKFEKA